MKYFLLILLLCGFTYSSLPAFADDETSNDDPNVEHIPTYHLYEDINLISKMKFSYGKPKIIIKAVYPEIKSETEDDYLDHFNELIKTMVQNITDEFKSRVKENLNLQKNMPASIVKNDLYIDYDTSMIKSGEDHIMSIRFSVQGYIAGMAHPYHSHLVFNYDLDSGEQLQLDDLFMPHSNYLAYMANYARNILLRRLSNKEMIDTGTAPDTENYSNWNIKPEGLLITFDEYQVAPYVNGTQTVLIPYSVLKPMLEPDAAIAACVKNTRRCSANNLLTGGFIDEAVNAKHGVFDPILS